MSLGQLDTNLCRFYTESRKESKGVYKKSALIRFYRGIEIQVNAPLLTKTLNYLPTQNVKG